MKTIIRSGMLLKTAQALGLSLLLSGSALAVDIPTLAPVKHNVTALLAHAHFAGHHASTAPLRLTIGLKLRNRTQLQQFLHELQDPSSPNYRHFLQPQQFAELYGPTREDISQVTGFLTRNGIRVTDVSPNGLLVHAVAETDIVEKALHVDINDYLLNGRSFYSATQDPQLPANLGGLVESVMGLDNAVVMQPHHIVKAALQAQRPASVSGPAGYSPQQIATAYHWPNILNTNHGAGVSIGIATAYAFRALDVNRFWGKYGLAQHTLKIVHVDGVTRVNNDETTLDVERSGAMAPGASIHVYEGVNPQFSTFTDVYNQIVTDDLVDVVSTSWGAPESFTPPSVLMTDDAIFAQATAQGISVFAAAGDNGASDGTEISDTADFPASDPNVAAAGGTHLELNPDNTIASESAWGGAGGADSAVFLAADYQLTYRSGQTETTPRQTSDMSLNADPNTGYSYYFNGRWQVAGGTSFVAPELAGLFAVIVARTGRIGLANHWIYEDATCIPTDFHDITTGSNGFSAGTGWDHPTGWGSPDGNNFVIDVQAFVASDGCA